MNRAPRLLDRRGSPARRRRGSLWLWALAALGSTAMSLSSAQAVDWPSKVPSPTERGQELYERHCMACHGPGGAGDGPAAASLTAEVPDLSQGYGDRRFEDMVRIVMRGKGVMPAYEVSFDRDDSEYLARYLGGVGRTWREAQAKKAEEAEKEAAEASDTDPTAEDEGPGPDARVEGAPDEGAADDTDAGEAEAPAPDGD